MNQIVSNLGHAAGLVGALICLIAGLGRITGAHHLADFEATTLFMVGTGLMVFACMVKLELIIRDR